MKTRSIKALSIASVAILLGLGGVAMANDSGENHQDYTNTTGYNPYMPEFSTGAPQGRSAFAQAPIERPSVQHVQHPATHRPAKR